MSYYSNLLNCQQYFFFFVRLLSLLWVQNMQSANTNDRNRFCVINTPLFFDLLTLSKYVLSVYFSPWYTSSAEWHGSFRISSLNVCVIILAYPAIPISPDGSVFVFLFFSITIGECEGHVVCVISGLPRCSL